MKITFILLGIFLTTVFTYAQDCVYLAYEPFDYPAQGMENNGGGQSFGKAWEIQNNDNVSNGFRTASEFPMAYSDLRTVGNYATGGYEFLTAGRFISLQDDGLFAPYLNNTGSVGAWGTTVWASALIRKEINNDQPVWLDFHNSSISWCPNCNGSESSIAIGYFGSASNANGQRYWSMRINGTVHRSNVPLTVGETSFLAVQVAFGDPANLQLYVNPTDIGGTAPSSDLSVQAPSTTQFRSLALYLGNHIDNGSIDEIRIASSWMCVSPDQSVSVNLPPTASIDLSTESGTAPLTVQHSAQNSSDPDGSIAFYEWILPNQTTATGIDYNFTYTYTGNIDVGLRVKDNNGAASTTYRTLTILDGNNTFSCLASLTMLQQANCETGSGGAFRLNTNEEGTAEVRNENGDLVTASSRLTYTGLDAGKYALVFNGNNGCSNDFDVHITVDSNSCENWQPRECFSRFGMNLSGFADWQKERPMRNLYKHVRASHVTFFETCNCWDLNVSSELTLDENDYPIGLPQSTSAGDVGLRWVLSSNSQGGESGNLQPNSRYVLLYDGQANMTLNGVAEIHSNSAGRIEFTTHPIPTLDNIWLNVYETPAADYIRNIRLLRIEDEFVNLDNNPFYEGFLEKIEPFSCLRFMDWGSTNGSPLQKWEERTSTTTRTYGIAAGAPYETMIQLANTASKDVWVCVPHMADSNYIRQMARLFRDQLDNDLEIYLEYSNEVWNFIFPQAQYNIQTAPPNLNYGRAYAEKAGTVFSLWLDEFGAESDRVSRVLGLQLTNNWLNEQILSQLSQDEWDYASPSWYFGLGGNPALDASSTPLEVIDYARNVFEASVPSRRQDYQNIKIYGKGIIEYEGGQHFTNLTQTPFVDSMIEAQKIPEMYDLYADVMDSLLRWGSEMPVAFTLAGETDNIFNFSHLDDIDLQSPFLQTAPKYQALLDFSCLPIVSSIDNPVDADVSGNEDVLVFPNPAFAGQQITHSSSANIDGISIYTMEGKVVHSENFDIPIQIIHTSLTLKPGLYLIEYKLTAGKKSQKKLVVVDH